MKTPIVTLAWKLAYRNNRLRRENADLRYRWIRTLTQLNAARSHNADLNARNAVLMEQAPSDLSEMEVDS